MDIDNDNNNDSAGDSDDDYLLTMNLRPQPDRGNATSATSNRKTSNNNNGTAIAAGRNQKPRLNEIIFDPIPEYGSTSYALNLRHLFSSNRFEGVTLQELRDMDSLPTVNCIDVQMLRIILQPRGANNQAFIYPNNKGRLGARRHQFDAGRARSVTAKGPQSCESLDPRTNAQIVLASRCCK